MVITSAPSRVVTAAGPLPHIAAGTSTGVEGVARVTIAAETLLYQNRDARDTLDARRYTHNDAGEGPAMVTTLNGAYAMTTRRSKVIAPNQRGPRLLVGISSRRRSHPDTACRLTS